MPVIRMSYLDLSPQQRRAGAKVVKERLRASLSNPDLASDQVQQLQRQLAKIEAWERGALAQRPVPKELSPVTEKADPQFAQRLRSLQTPKN